MNLSKEDGPMLCIWKILQDKDWMTTDEILTALKDGHYSEGHLRAAISKMSSRPVKYGMDSRRATKLSTTNSRAREYKLQPNAPQPVETVRLGGRKNN